MKNTALLVSSVLIGLLAIEAGLRMAGFAPRTLAPNRFFVEGTLSTWSVPDPVLGWINREGTSRSIEEGAAPMTFWSHGRRASRPTPEPYTQSNPIMIVGGSNAQSYGVRDEASFPYILSERFSDIWIENFGNGGFGTAQSYLLTQRMLNEFYGERSPSLVLLTFADSHVARNVSDQSWIYSISDFEGRYVAPPHYQIDGADLEFRPFKTIKLWPAESRSALVTTLHHVWLQSIAYNTADQGVAVTRELMKMFDGFVRSRGSEFAVVILEDYRQISPDLFEGLDFPVIDCSGYERTAPSEYLLGGGSHPNAKYHLHYADCIGQWLTIDYFASSTDSLP